MKVMSIFTRLKKYFQSKARTGVSLILVGIMP
jgi:hypothetical protein